MKNREVLLDCSKQWISVTDVLYQMLGLTNVDDLVSASWMRPYVAWCHAYERSDGRRDLMADVVVMSCILRSVNTLGASTRLECARKVAELLRMSPLIADSVFEIDVNGCPHNGRFSDLLVAPLPRGVLTAKQVGTENEASFRSMISFKFAVQQMKKAKVSDEVRRRFRDEIKEMARLREDDTTPSPCDPGWAFVNIADQSVGMSFRMFGGAHSTLILHSVSTQFERIKDFPVHFAPETRIFDQEWIAKVEEDAHVIVTGVTRERFRQMQENLLEGEDEVHAYNPHTLDLFEYVKWVLYAAEDHRGSRPDLVASITARFGDIAARFGSRILARRVMSRRYIEKSKLMASVERMVFLQESLGTRTHVEEEDEGGDGDGDGDGEDDDMMADGIPYPP